MCFSFTFPVLPTCPPEAQMEPTFPHGIRAHLIWDPSNAPVNVRRVTLHTLLVFQKLNEFKKPNKTKNNAIVTCLQKQVRHYPRTSEASTSRSQRLMSSIHSTRVTWHRHQSMSCLFRMLLPFHMDNSRSYSARLKLVHHTMSLISFLREIPLHPTSNHTNS